MSDKHCHADGAGPCLANDCPIAGKGPIVVRGGQYLRPCPGADGPQHALERREDVMTRDSYIPPVVLDHMEARTDDPAALAEIARLRAEQTIYRYDPQPVNWQDETQLWEKLRTEGGNVVDAEGRIIARIHPAAEDDDDSGEWVATITFDQEQS